jgi:hypothetical protein
MSSQIPKSRRKELSVLKNSHARLTAYLSALKVTATSTAGYSYRPLNRDRKEIRLLTLEPGYRGTTIRCTLKHAFLDECPIPHYETISYTCGDPALRSRIMLHDIPTDVPTSSEVVLRRMRRPTARRVLWDRLDLYRSGEYSRTWTPSRDDVRDLREHFQELGMAGT